MTDYQRVVDEIRAFLQGTDQTLTDGLKELASLYGDACREVNQRLRRCEEYLKKGLRGEAIHYAEAEPVLLDVVAVLDFPERSDFHETLIFYALPEPPQLLLKIAKDLNQAYAEEQPLEELLPRHRRLALLRAPVLERLQVLRQIAELDQDNPLWGEDVRLFEGARLREIQTAMAGPSKGDAGRVAEFARELSRGDWLTLPPAALVAQVGKQAAFLAREQVRLELGNVLVQLHAAMATDDLAQGQNLRDRYQQLGAQVELANDDPLAQQAARPMKWLSQREKKQKRDLEVEMAFSALENALSQQVEPGDAAELYDEALQLVDKLPRGLEERYRAYLYQANAAQRRRERLILVIVIIVGILLFVGLIGFLRFRSHTPPPTVTWLAVSRSPYFSGQKDTHRILTQGRCPSEGPSLSRASAMGWCDLLPCRTNFPTHSHQSSE